jgi:hypothetical protein
MKAVLTTQMLSFFILILAYGCVKELSFENHGASGTLKDASGSCFFNALHGTFYNGLTPGADSAYMEVQVNVLKTGSYTISTDTQNGLQFASSGVFDATGINIIKLRPEGTPLAAVSTDFTIRFDTSICFLTVNVQDSAVLHRQDTTGTLPFNNWKFTDTKRKITYKGLFDINYIYVLGLSRILVLATKNPQVPGDSSFMINLDLPTGAITTGTFTTDRPPNGIVFKSFSNPCVNCAGGGLIPPASGATVIIIITAYDPATKIVKGTFSGTSIDWLNQVAPIADGEFSAVVE